jgi:hypothetical protein
MNTISTLTLAALSITLLTQRTAAESAKQSPTDFQITLGGEVGIAADANMARFRSSPFDSLPWLRADLTGENAPEFSKICEGGMPFRPFREYSGDISGRFIEIMAMNSKNSPEMNPAFRELLKEVPKHQRPGGYFCASGEINWQQPIDRTSAGDSSIMLPALWGNARILCGLIEASRAFPENKEILATTKKLGDFYVGVVPRFTDPARLLEYTNGTSYASGYITCWFPAMEGLVKISALTGDTKYLEAAKTIAEFYKLVDFIPLDHSHGMLCCQVSLLLLYEATKEASYLERVEKRWDALVQGGYINPAGGILEKCKLVDPRDEGCAEADWLRLNLELGRVTHKSRYWDMAERLLNNQFLQNQSASGGFGHYNMFCDKEGVRGFGGTVLESTWCCDYHGQIGFVNLRSHLLDRNAVGLTCNLALDFTAKLASGTVKSIVSVGAAAGEVMRQRIQLDDLPANVVRIRQPQWADAVTALAADGSALPLTVKDGYYATKKPVTGVTFVYVGGVYAEGRRCNRLPKGPVDGQPFALGFGPKLFAAANQSITLPAWPTTVEALKAQGVELMSSALRSKDYRFVFDR